MNEKLFNTLRNLNELILPAMATFYIAIADTWKLPLSQEIATTILALVTFLGIIIKVARANFNGKDITDGE